MDLCSPLREAAAAEQSQGGGGGPDWGWGKADQDTAQEWEAQAADHRGGAPG